FLLYWERPCPPRSVQNSLYARSSLVMGHDDPALVLGDRRRFLDQDGVANLVGVVLIVRLVLLRHAHDLLHHRMREAALHLHHDGLVVLVADDDALQNTLWHGFYLMPSWPRLFPQQWS